MRPVKWSPKGTFALLAGALFTALLDGQRQAPFFTAALGGSLAESIVNGLEEGAAQAPWQRLQGILRTSIQRAAAKVYRTDPFELPAG